MRLLCSVGFSFVCWILLLWFVGFGGIIGEILRWLPLRSAC